MLKPFQTPSYIYGPVPSRRLGLSLGVDIVPFKICTFNCVYCQLGKTVRQSGRRGRFFPVSEVMTQIRKALDQNPQIDHITFSGSGEPPLNTAIGELIRRIKTMTDIPVAVLTNSSLLVRPSVRKALVAADIVIPSLDAARAASFRRVNRPLPSLKIEKIILGLETFRREFKGRIWLEVMLVKGINDSPADIQALKKAIARIRPDRIHLNTVVRPPAEKWAKPLSRRALETIKKDLGEKAEVVAEFRRHPRSPAGQNLREAILAMVERRPVTLADITVSLGRNETEVQPHLDTLLSSKAIRRRRHQGSVYFAPYAPREDS
jgi:wyosine [tRNA(Phe)-imidazoG37] synthetase (radical SAM superfamily)